MSMRYFAMQLLTWGTIAGAIGSALLLATLDNPAHRYSIELSVALPLPSEPTQAGRARAKPVQPAAPSAIASAASTR